MLGVKLGTSQGKRFTRRHSFGGVQKVLDRLTCTDTGAFSGVS